MPCSSYCKKKACQFFQQTSKVLVQVKHTGQQKVCAKHEPEQSFTAVTLLEVGGYKTQKKFLSELYDE